MRKLRVYTVINTELVNAGAAGGNNFQLNNYNRTCLLRSILFDIQITNLANHQLLPLEQNTTQDFVLHIDAFPIGIPFAQLFEDPLVPALFVNNGIAFDLYRPKQIVFDSFYLRNSLNFDFVCHNWDVLLNYNYLMSLTVEIEDIEVL